MAFIAALGGGKAVLRTMKPAAAVKALKKNKTVVIRTGKKAAAKKRTAHRKGIMIRICIAAAILVGTTIAAAAEPLSIPNRGGSCPNGYLASGSYCVPSAAAPTRGTRLAKPPNGQCPWGWLASDTQCLRSGR